MIVPRHGKYYAWADVIAGDFHYIRRNMPPDLRGKITPQEYMDTLLRAGIEPRFEELTPARPVSS